MLIWLSGCEGGSQKTCSAPQGARGSGVVISDRGCCRNFFELDGQSEEGQGYWAANSGTGVPGSAFQFALDRRIPALKFDPPMMQT